jgi:CheY-like chemotaxis protein
LLGGEITATPRPSGGSIFRVRLMLSEAPTRDQRPPEQIIIGYTGARRTILVIDDDRAHVDLVEELLTPLGFTMVTAMTGPDGLDGAARCHPDLVLLDLTMPGMSGWEVASTLRERGPDDIAILIVSADAHVLSGRPGGTMLHDDFLIKPFAISDLLDRVQTLLDLEWVVDPAPATPTATDRMTTDA